MFRFRSANVLKIFVATGLLFSAISAIVAETHGDVAEIGANANPINDDSPFGSSTATATSPLDVTKFFSSAKKNETIIAYLERHQGNNSWAALKASIGMGQDKIVLQPNVSVAPGKLMLLSCGGPQGFICWIGRLDAGHFMEIHCHSFKFNNVTRIVLPVKVKLPSANTKLLAENTCLVLDNSCNNLYWRDPTNPSSSWVTSLSTQSSAKLLDPELVPLPWSRISSSDSHLLDSYADQHMCAEAGAVEVPVDAGGQVPLDRDDLNLTEGSPEQFTVLSPDVLTIESSCSNRAVQCNHICVTRSPDTSSCLCSVGFILSGDNSTCQPSALLYVQVVSSSNQSLDLVLDPTGTEAKSRKLCTIYPNSELLKDPETFPPCPPWTVRQALTLSYGLIDPSHPGHALFKKRLAFGIQMTYEGYLYRPPENPRCIHLVSASTGTEIPFFCLHLFENLLYFVVDVSTEEPIIHVLFSRRTTIVTGELIYMITFKVYTNVRIGTRTFSRLRQGLWMAGDTNSRQLFAAFRNGKAVRYRLYDADEWTNLATISSVGQYQTTEVSNQEIHKYFQCEKLQSYYYRLDFNGSTERIVEFRDNFARKRTLLTGKELLSTDYELNFVQLPFLPKIHLEDERDAGWRCSKSCILVDSNLDQCLCPYTMHRHSEGKICRGGISYFAVYDDTLEFPLSGREELAGQVHHEIGGANSTMVLIVKSSTVTSRMNGHDLCWTYEGRGDVWCRSLLDGSHTPVWIGGIHPKSTFLLFSLDAKRMYFNSGKLGQISMFDFELNDTYTFPEFQPSGICKHTTWSLDTEQNIYFWGGFDGVIGMRLLNHDMNSTVTVSSNVSINCVDSLALDMQLERVYFRANEEYLGWIQYEHVFRPKSGQVQFLERLNLLYSASGLFFALQHLWWINNAMSNKAVKENAWELMHGVTRLGIRPDYDTYRTIRTELLFSRPGDNYWKDLTAGLSLRKGQEKRGLLPFEVRASQKMLFLTPPTRTSFFDPCSSSLCSHFCFRRVKYLVDPDHRLFVCACPKNLVLSNSSTYQCVEKEYNNVGEKEATHVKKTFGGNNLGEIEHVPDGEVFHSNDSSNENKDEPPVQGLNVGTYIGASIPILVIVALLIFYLWRRKRSSKLANTFTDILDGNMELATLSKTDSERAEYLPLSCIIPPDELVIEPDHVLGKGQFGKVLRGKYNDIPVAVKTVKSDVNSSHLTELSKEIKVLHYIGEHPHIVKFYGAEISRFRKGLMYLVMEFSPFGCLLAKLKTLELESDMCVPENYVGFAPEEIQYLNDESETLSNKMQYRLLDWAEQVAKGMKHLAEKNIVHGDLAARNVLVFENDVLKIADFGLSKRMENLKIYTRGSDAALPWRWMAYETLKGRKISLKSDVWSYGVTVWEIFSLGDTPYAGRGWNKSHIIRMEAGEVLQQPPKATEDIYAKVMKPCWDLDPELRPNFDYLIATILGLKRTLSQTLVSIRSREQALFPDN